MIGICEIGTYIPDRKEDNIYLADRFDLTEDFIEKKIGVRTRRIKSDDESVLDMCTKAFENLTSKIELNVGDTDCIILVTQNPDQNIPHTSALIQHSIGASEQSACFDISLGCSGYVYAISVITSFMAANNMKQGLLFTCDPYSKIIDSGDKNTCLLFGDAATVTLISSKPKLIAQKHLFGTQGKSAKELQCKNKLEMNGRAVLNFTATTIPASIEAILSDTGISKDEIYRWYFHQGSRYILDTIRTRCGINPDRIAHGILDYGNTVSSTIPLLLASDMKSIPPGKPIIMSGFGVGLSWSTALFNAT